MKSVFSSWKSEFLISALQLWKVPLSKVIMKADFSPSIQTRLNCNCEDIHPLPVSKNTFLDADISGQLLAGPLSKRPSDSPLLCSGRERRRWLQPSRAERTIQPDFLTFGSTAPLEKQCPPYLAQALPIVHPFTVSTLSLVCSLYSNRVQLLNWQGGH